MASQVTQWYKLAMQETEDENLIPGLGRSLKGRNNNTLQYSCLDDRINRGAGCVTVHGVTKRWARQDTTALNNKATNTATMASFELSPT